MQLYAFLLLEVHEERSTIVPESYNEKGVCQVVD